MYRGWRVVLCIQCWHKPFVALCTIKTGDKKFFRNAKEATDAARRGEVMEHVPMDEILKRMDSGAKK